MAICGRAEGVRGEGGRGGQAGGGDLPAGGNQPGDLLQLKEEVRGSAAVRDATVAGA
jgi:hypothetical protein